MGRTPPGVRGLKRNIKHRSFKTSSRTPPGVRGLKLALRLYYLKVARRTPPGVRGLKLSKVYHKDKLRLSHPAWGAWIETCA